MTTVTEGPRLPYHGSCHCGRVKYIIFISMPPAVAFVSDVDTQSRVRFLKCNCSTCHKTGYFHMRLSDAPNDFYLLSPLDIGDLSDYQCFDREVHWYFCPTCGVRCFTAQGKWQLGEVDLDDSGVELSKKEGDQYDRNYLATKKKTPIWQLDPEGYEENRKGYLSVNALTIDRDQVHGSDLDLRQIVDKKWLKYADCKNEEFKDRYDYPHEGGTW